MKILFILLAILILLLMITVHEFGHYPVSYTHLTLPTN